MSVAGQVLTRYAEGKDLATIAREIGVSRSRVRQIVNEAKSREYDKLLERGVASPLPGDEEQAAPADMNELIRRAARRGAVEDEGASDGA